MTSVNRERAFETKLSLLEKRLVLVERFVEMRFCESFRDFSIRNGSSLTDEWGTSTSGGGSSKRMETEVAEPVTVCDGDGSHDEGDSDDRESYVPTRTRSGRKTKRPARLSTSVTPISSPRKSKTAKESMKLQVTRVESTQEDSEGIPVISSKTTEISTSSVQFIIKTAPLSEDEAMGGDVDDYFTFPHDGDDGPQEVDDADDSNDYDVEKQDDDSDGESGSDYDVPRTVRTKTGSSSSPKRSRGRPKKKGVAVSPGCKLVLANSVKEECSVCHKYFKKDLMPSHMEFHTKERHLKCSFCDKKFFNKSMVAKHEKLHQPEKYAKKCRLCDKTTIESGKMLVHERSCIRRALEQNKHVDPALIEEIRRRSQGIDLKWPDQNGNPNEKRCSYCSKYVNVNNYQKHLRVHATWVCTLCDNSYINKEGLVKHMRNIHGASDADNKNDGDRQDVEGKKENTGETQDDEEEMRKTVVNESQGENEVEMEIEDSQRTSREAEKEGTSDNNTTAS